MAFCGKERGLSHAGFIRFFRLVILMVSVMRGEE